MLDFTTSPLDLLFSGNLLRPMASTLPQILTSAEEETGEQNQLNFEYRRVCRDEYTDVFEFIVGPLLPVDDITIYIVQQSIPQAVKIDGAWATCISLSSSNVPFFITVNYSNGIPEKFPELCFVIRSSAVTTYQLFKHCATSSNWSLGDTAVAIFYLFFFIFFFLISSVDAWG